MYGASNGSSRSDGKLMTGPTTTGTSRLFNSSATFQASVAPLRITFSLSSSASFSASVISGLRYAWMTTGFWPRAYGTSASSRGFAGVWPRLRPSS